MTLLRDKQNRWYLLAVSLLCVSLVGGCLLFCAGQTRAAHMMLLEQEQNIAGGLLERGVPQEIIAAALDCEADSGPGRELLTLIGRTENTPRQLFPTLRAFEKNTIWNLLPGVILSAALLLCAALLFLLRLDARYRGAEQIIRCFACGDFSSHLPRTGEGTLARLFAAVDDLACALQAEGKTEHRTKEFLKTTISDISHQLKTPLAALRMYHEIIEEEVHDPAVVTEFSQKTEMALSRMEGLIQALLKITRLDAGGIVFEREQIRVAGLVSRAMADLGTRAELEQKTITVKGYPEDAVVCDPEWTSEAVGNLIKNALDHTSAGGQIAIVWEHSPAVVRITVSDNGCGIAAEDIHHIFKRFYRSRHSLDRQGVGLGLPLAKAIIEGQGGVLTVRSAPGEGAAFTISFLTEV